MATRHVARAVGATGASAPEWHVDIRAGAHALVADEPTAGGGQDAGPSPLGLLMSALVACTAMTLWMYVQRKGGELDGVEVDALYSVDDDDAASIERIITRPAGLPVEQRERLADVAERTPVTLAVRRDTPITTTVRP